MVHMKTILLHWFYGKIAKVPLKIKINRAENFLVQCFQNKCLGKSMHQQFWGNLNVIESMES